MNVRNRFCLVRDCSLVQNDCNYLKLVPRTWCLVVPSVVPSAKAAHLGLESRCPKHTTQAVSFVGPTNARHTCNNQGRTEVELQWAGEGLWGCIQLLSPALQQQGIADQTKSTAASHALHMQETGLVLGEKFHQGKLMRFYLLAVELQQDTSMPQAT